MVTLLPYLVVFFINRPHRLQDCIPVCSCYRIRNFCIGYLRDLLLFPLHSQCNCVPYLYISNLTSDLFKVDFFLVFIE
jgi:hypothetical protein